MERKITIEESVPYTEDYQNKMLEENQVEFPRIFGPKIFPSNC